MKFRWPGQSLRAFRRSHAVANRLLLCLCCYFFLTGLMQSLVSLRGVEAGLDGVNLGLALGLASGSAGVLLDIPIGAWADLVGRRRVAQIGLSCSFIAAIMLLFDSQILLMCGAFLAGLGVIVAGAPLLSWLSSAAPPREQARLQGMNSSAQRIGALLAVAAVGVAIGLSRLDIMSLGAVVAVSVALLALGNRAMRAGDRVAGAQPMSAFVALGRPPSMRRVATIACRDEVSGVSGVVTSYALGFRMVVQRPILLAGAINLGINVIFLATNSYVPLIEGPHRATILISTLVARDLAAVAVGIATAVFGLNVSSMLVLAPAFALAGISTWILGFLTAGAFLVCTGAIQGIALGVGIAATNLFAASSAPTRMRTIAMAASFFQGRLMLFVLPIVCSLLLTRSGVQDVFQLLGLILLVVSFLLVILGRTKSQVIKTIQSRS